MERRGRPQVTSNPAGKHLHIAMRAHPCAPTPTRPSPSHTTFCCGGMLHTGAALLQSGRRASMICHILLPIEILKIRFPQSFISFSDGASASVGSTGCPKLQFLGHSVVRVHGCHVCQAERVAVDPDVAPPENGKQIGATTRPFFYTLRFLLCSPFASNPLVSFPWFVTPTPVPLRPRSGP